jgi:hypothetical protein
MGWTKLSPQWARHSDGYETSSVDRDYVQYTCTSSERILIFAESTIDFLGLSDIDEYNRLPTSEQLRRYVTCLSVSSARLDPPTRDLSPDEKRIAVERAAEGWRFLGSRVQIVN